MSTSQSQTDDTTPADADQGSFRVAVKAAPLRQSVTDAIRNSIILGHFKPGDRMPERRICEMTGVSRTLVREALRQLESEGLIEVLPHRGPIVCTLSRASALDIYEVRTELEGLACRRFIENAQPEQMAALRRSLEKMRISSRSSDLLERVNAKNDFYDTLISGAGSDAIGSCLTHLNSRIVLLRANSLKSPGRIDNSIEELENLLDALEQGDAEAAVELSRRHVQRAAEVALKFLDD